jgi:hypothetical protein
VITIRQEGHSFRRLVQTSLPQCYPQRFAVVGKVA